MAEPLEATVGTLNHVIQTAKGAAPDFTETTPPADRPKWFDGVLDPNKVLTSESYIDGQAFDSPTVTTDKIGGDVGNVVIQGQPENVGIYLAEILASDTVTGAADPYTHTSTSGNGVQRYGAWAQSVGTSSPQRHIFADAKLASLVMESGQEQQTLHLDMTIRALKVGQVFTTAPAKGENTSDPYLHTEQEGQVTFDGTAFETDSSVLEISRDHEIRWFEKHTPSHLIEKRASIKHTLKTIATDDTLAKRNKVLYGTPTPAADAVPVKDVFYASVTRKYVRSANRSLEIQTPRVAIDPQDMKVGPNREGGAVEMTFGGMALRNGATPALTIIAKTGDADPYYA